MAKVRADFSKLTKLAQELGKKRVVRVGIVGAKATATHGAVPGAKETSADLTVAEVGAIHEFGSHSRNIPRRSFLNDPIRAKATEIFAQAAKGMGDMVEAVKGGLLWRRIGVAAVAQVLEAFSKRGPGWAPLKPATIKAKGSDAPLIDEGQLRGAVSFQVVSK